ncbi:MAG: hypothetical protein WCT52_05430 [Candidatus Micrarchaeia archaeon]
MTDMYEGKSLAFEMKGNRLKVMLEEVVPTVRVAGETYFVTESPSVSVNGKKYFVDEIA